MMSVVLVRVIVVCRGQGRNESVNSANQCQGLTEAVAEHRRLVFLLREPFSQREQIRSKLGGQFDQFRLRCGGERRRGRNGKGSTLHWGSSFSASFLGRGSCPRPRYLIPLQKGFTVCCQHPA